MQGARQPHPIPRGTAPAVTSWASPAIWGSKGGQEGLETPEVLTCPAQPISDPQSCFSPIQARVP